MHPHVTQLPATAGANVALAHLFIKCYVHGAGTGDTVMGTGNL